MGFFEASDNVAKQTSMIYGKAIANITKGQVVAINGSSTQKVSFAVANAGNATLKYAVGIAMQNITNGQMGYVITYGLIRGINTNAFTEGNRLYLGATAGTLVNTLPALPNGQMFIGYCIKKSTTDGIVFIDTRYIPCATDVSILDADGYFAATNVENALKEMYENAIIDLGINDAVVALGTSWSSTKINTEISNKIKTATFTAVANNTTNIVHNLTYDPLHDDLLAFYMGLLLENPLNYTDNVNNISINLVDWSINTGEKIYFKLYKNVK